MLKVEGHEPHEMDCAWLKSDGIEENKQIAHDGETKRKIIQITKKC